MTTFVGREVWSCALGILSHGKVIEQKEYALVVMCDDGERRVFHPDAVRLHLASVLDDVDDQIDYWERKREHVIELLRREDDVIAAFSTSRKGQ